MDFNGELPASLVNLKEENLSDIRAELIGCLDDDKASGKEPQTLLLADALAKKIQSPLFEADNGHFDFTQQMTAEALRNVKSRLRINFSREKLEFACKVISALNGTSTTVGTTVPQSTEEEATPVPVISTQPEQPVETVTPEEPAPKEPKQPETPSSPAAQAHSKTPPRPPKPNAEPPKGWKESSSVKPTSAESTQNRSAAQPNRPAAPPRQTTSQHHQGPFKASPTIGFWERSFATIGRRIDNLLKRLFK